MKAETRKKLECFVFENQRGNTSKKISRQQVISGINTQIYTWWISLNTLTIFSNVTYISANSYSDGCAYGKQKQSSKKKQERKKLGGKD